MITADVAAAAEAVLRVLLLVVGPEDPSEAPLFVAPPFFLLGAAVPRDFFVGGDSSRRRVEGMAFLGDLLLCSGVGDFPADLFPVDAVEEADTAVAEVTVVAEVTAVTAIAGFPASPAFAGFTAVAVFTAFPAIAVFTALPAAAGVTAGAVRRVLARPRSNGKPEGLSERGERERSLRALVLRAR